MIYIILLVLFLLLMGAVISGTFAERSSKIDRPPIYYNKSFIQLINLLLIPMVILFIVLMILDWKITLIEEKLMGSDLNIEFGEMIAK